jgi:DNA invertase Pin-like site-specific DNA recombinase
MLDPPPPLVARMPRNAAILPALPAPDGAADVIGYVRVSTEDQVGDVKTSLATQRAEIGQLAQRFGRTLAPGAIFEDPGVSGQTAEDRPGFMAMVAFCERARRPRRTPGYVLVLNDSRFGRFHNPEEAAYWRVALERSGWLVRYAENDDSGDLTTRTVMRAIGASAASAYTAQLKANTRRGTRGTAAQGFWQNEAPLGYRRLATRNGRDPVVLDVGVRKADDQQVRLTFGPDNEVALVRWMFASYASGEASLGSLMRALRDKAPIRRWSRRCVEQVLKNVTYTGDVVWGRRPHDKRERQETPVRPASEWVVCKDAHPPIVTRELFDRVQAQFRVNRRERRHTQGGYPLSGLLTCVTCGRPYIGGGGNRGDAADPDRHRFYRHSHPDDSPACANGRGTLLRRFIQPAMIDAVASVVDRPAVRRAIERALDQALAARTTTAPAELGRLESRLVALEAERGRLVAAVARGVLADDEARDELARCRAETAGVTAEIERARFRGRASSRLRTERDAVLALAIDFRARATELSGIALRELLRPWLANAVVDNENCCVEIHIRQVPAAGPFLLLSQQPAQG